jgi:N-acetyl-gamma-glutamyl-phosphate reductase
MMHIYDPAFLTGRKTEGVSGTVRASILGASGYSGAELLKILLRHPSVSVDRLFAGASAGKQVVDLYPSIVGAADMAYLEYAPELVSGSDILFLALPPGEAMILAPGLVASGRRVIDLSGDFRLPDTAIYTRYYQREHRAPALLAEAVYGMSELYRERIAEARLVANPGCYPTSVILPLAPLLAEDLIEKEGIVINSLSGLSGAGRKGSVELSFCEVNESARAYKVGTHQHIPEIARILCEIAGADVAFTFIPHLIPLSRGIHTTISAPLKPGVDARQIDEAFASAYGSEPFIRAAAGRTPEVRGVAGTNLVDIGYHIDDANGRVTVLSAIDNLIKGAAGQAVQNMNILFELEETEGLR